MEPAPAPDLPPLEWVLSEIGKVLDAATLDEQRQVVRSFIARIEAQMIPLDDRPGRWRSLALQGEVRLWLGAVVPL
jgi:hypothetical protein